MSTIIIITPPPKNPKSALEPGMQVVGVLQAAAPQEKIRIEVGDTGTLADRLRAAADLLEGAP